MEIINFNNSHSVLNQYMAEIRDIQYQQNRLLFRHNMERIGEIMAYEISKTLPYCKKEIPTVLGTATTDVPCADIVLGTIFRAGLPFHQGFMHVYDKAGAAFVSAYREYTDNSHTSIAVHVEYLAAPSMEKKTLIIADPMLATGESMELAYNAFLSKGTPRHIHIACVIASPEGIEHVKNLFPQDNTTLWCAAIDDSHNEHKSIVPGLGDAGDLCYGEKI